ncbi:hypothetical protein [Actinopolymorpha sp. B9G3]|uniref:hypothetical protein n=1 Tax=Actinopolymorpha sp. B9G3 TaxID=3158970 RepID=UPI0032D9607C
MIKSPLGRLLRSLINRRTVGVHIGAAVVLGGLAALSAPASASVATAIDPGSAARSFAADGTPHDGGKDHKKKNKALCIDSTFQGNDKILAYVPEKGQLWIWKENRGAGSVDPWIQFVETADTEPTPIPENVICATVAVQGNSLHVTIVTDGHSVKDAVNNAAQRVWQTVCTVNPDNANFPFDPNGELPNGDPRCEGFEELTPLPESNEAANEPREVSPSLSSTGPNTGDGASASASGGVGPTAMAGAGMLGLALTAGSVMLLRRRGHGTAEA